MEILKWVLYTVILLSSILVSMILANLCKDELKLDRRYFKIFLQINAIFIWLSLIFYRSINFVFTLVYAEIVIGLIYRRTINAKN